MVGPLLGMSDVERRRQIQHISQRMAAPLRAVHGNLPPRALALLTPVAEPSLGSAWLQNAPPPRLGYRAERGLRRVLRAIAERGQWHA